jgi:hypothetical protein
VIGVVNVGRLDQIVTLVGSPGAQIPDARLTGLLRSAAARMRTALSAKKTAITG